MIIKKAHEIAINSSKGGNGDIWMRLIGFYTLAAMQPNIKISILIPSFFRGIASIVFGDRLVILDETSAKDKDMLVYTSLGLLSLLKGIVIGKKFIAPYQREVVYDKKEKSITDSINIKLFEIADFFGVIQIPQWKDIKEYQAYLDVIAIKKLRNFDYGNFVRQLHADYDSFFLKLNGTIPISKELQVPFDLQDNVLVFPTGTARQFMPIWWAKLYLPNAYFAFFHKDPDADIFRANGLKVVNFYNEPGDIVALSNKAKWTISTDSFPSHILQYCSNRCTITITEVLRSRIISPVFKGKVIDSQVACHPCLHLDRTNNPYCEAGHSECLNWKNKLYTQNIINSIE